MDAVFPNTSKNSRNPPNARRKKRKKVNAANTVNKNVQKRNNFKKKTKLALTMYSWAENFTAAATWQLKHQVAYWKAKATALDYENKVLHDVIRKNHAMSTSQVSTSDSEEDNEPHNEDSSENCNDDVSDQILTADDPVVVSNEYIQFLLDNAEHKEEARMERERLRARNDAEEQHLEDEMGAGPSEPVDKTEELKKLYGDDWQRIGALEMSMQANFINECDKLKPAYWPVLPLNFNFS